MKSKQKWTCQNIKVEAANQRIELVTKGKVVEEWFFFIKATLSLMGFKIPYPMALKIVKLIRGV